MKRKRGIGEKKKHVRKFKVFFCNMNILIIVANQIIKCNRDQRKKNTFINCNGINYIIHAYFLF